MKIDTTDIYIDAKHLHVLLYRAQFTMRKADRIVMGNRLLDLSQNMVAVLSRAIMAEDEERLKRIDELRGEFDALRLNLQAAENLSMFKESRSTVDRNSGELTNIGPLVLGMFERVDKIDKGISRWRSAVRSRITVRR